ncbi:hypothetical protein P4233_11135 [Pseudomonas aeruginosa]|nr:hypothetical protein [Pseudomonas aeruginosa]
MQLADPPGGIGQPGFPPMAGQQRLALNVLVGLELVQLALEALLDERLNELAESGESPFGLSDIKAPFYVGLRD